MKAPGERLRIAYPLSWSQLGRHACREQTVNTAAALARVGADVTLLMPRRPADAHLTADDFRRYFHVSGDFKVVQRDCAWTSEEVFRSIMWARHMLRDEVVRSADLVLARAPIILALGAGGVRFAFDHYRPWPDQWPLFKGQFRRTILSDACLGVVTHSSFTADSFRRLRAPPEKILVAHNGFDTARMEPRLSRGEARLKLGLPSEEKIVLYAGRINRAKGLDEVLKLAELRPTVRFLLVGSEGEGPIEKAAARLPNVGVVPWRDPDKLAPYLYAADVLLIPPSSEPLQRFGNCILPLKTFLYLAAGRPILAPEAPDTAELLIQGQTALLVAPGDAAKAAQGLDRLLSEPEFAQSLSRGARAMADNLTWDHRARSLIDFLERRMAAGAGSIGKGTAQAA